MNKSTARKLIYARLVLHHGAKCAVCGIGDRWCGKRLRHHVDHVDGNGDNHDQTNVRLLCPNCHSQTSTFAGRNKKKSAVAQQLCPDCQQPKKTKKSDRCRSCAGKINTPVTINWPDAAELQRMVNASNLSAVGRVLGCSSTAVKNRLKTVQG